MATVYTWAGNQRAQAVQAVADLKNFSLKTADFVPGTAPAGFPSFVTAPVLTTASGDNISQLSAILAHVNGGCSAQELEFLAVAENVITPSASGWVFPTLGAMPNNKGVVSEAKKSLLAALDDLNNILATRTFLVGERVSVADVAVFQSLVLAFRQVLADNYRKNIPHVVRWFNTCAHQSAFKAFGAISFADKEAQFDAKTFAAINNAGKAPAAKKQQQKKQEQPKKKAAPKQEEPAAAAPAPKKEDPWAGLGGKIDMDAWKRCYSNNDTIPTAMNYFWEHLDSENYSVYFGKYKYGDEIAMPFMASNLIRGMYQRLDKMRKHSFGTMCVFGGEEKGDIEISGVFFWKGQDLAFELSEDWKVDYVAYDWRKLDVTSDADKALITQYFSWEGFEGKKFVDGKVYK